MQAILEAHPVTVRLCGPLIVEMDGRRLDAALPSRQGRLAFAYLVLHRTRTVSRSELMEALWPGPLPSSSDNLLSGLLSRMRRALPSGVLEGRAMLSVRLDPDAWVDVEVAARAPAMAREALTSGDATAAMAVASAALEILAQPLLPEIDRSWVDGRRRELEALVPPLLETIVRASLHAGGAELVAGEAAARRLIFLEPLRESAHALLMDVLAARGDVAQALQAYDGLRGLLREELGTVPSAAVRALAERLLSDGDSATRPNGASAVRARSVVQHVPAPPNRTIGRERELEAVQHRLVGGRSRLLTLVGPGGVGKTRLALEAARVAGPRFEHGARFVALDSVQRHEDVPMAIVGALAVVMLAAESPERALERYLAAKRLLLVLDNCEHLLGSAPFIAALIAKCPRLTVLATSREPLGIRAEESCPVGPLASEDAVAMFIERARARDAAFEVGGGDALEEICRRVDGLPLAIELAAARCGLLSPAEIAERLDTALGTPGALRRDAPARQQTLSATIDWSHALLEADEQACFDRFAVFAGGATLAATEAVTGTGIHVMDRLIAKSLLTRRGQRDGHTRLAMLETVRSYAAERLADAPDRPQILDRHYRYFVALAQRHATERALWGARRSEHLAALDADIENLHAALDWAVSDLQDAERALVLCEALGCYWLMRDRYLDAVHWIDRTLGLPGAEAHPALRVRVLLTRIWALYPLGRAGERPPILDEAEAIALRLPDRAFAAEVAYTRAAIEWADTGRGDVANALADDAVRLAEATGDDWAIAMAAYAKAGAPADAGEVRERVERAASLLEEAGIVYYLAYLLGGAAYTALRAEDDAYASDLIRRAVPVTRALDSAYLQAVLSGNAGLVALFTGGIDEAREALCESLALCRELVVLPWIHEGLAGAAAIAATDHDLDRAARLAGAATAHRYGVPGDEVDARLDATFLAPARARQGAGAWEAAEREGAALSLEDAIAYALAEPTV